MASYPFMKHLRAVNIYEWSSYTILLCWIFKFIHTYFIKMLPECRCIHCNWSCITSIWIIYYSHHNILHYIQIWQVCGLSNKMVPSNREWVSKTNINRSYNIYHFLTKNTYMPGISRSYDLHIIFWKKLPVSLLPVGLLSVLLSSKWQRIWELTR